MLSLVRTKFLPASCSLVFLIVFFSPGIYCSPLFFVLFHFRVALIIFEICLMACLAAKGFFPFSSPGASCDDKMRSR
jgi:hypothetical protein